MRTPKNLLTIVESDEYNVCEIRGEPVSNLQFKNCNYESSCCYPDRTMKVFQLKVPEDAIATFCKKWQITEFALFGSILRDDFRPDSDVDVLVNFVAEAKWSLFDIVRMKEELKTLFGREVDLVERDSLRNPFRRYEILRTKETIYAAE